MNKPLWEPTEQKKQDSLLEDFSKFINLKSNKILKIMGMECRKSRRILVKVLGLFKDNR